MATTDASASQPVVAAVSKPEAAETVNLASAPAANGPAAAAKQQPGGSSTGSGGTAFQGQPDDFYNNIFYFSGMGSVIGSALAEGVYVGEQYRKNAIDSDEVEKSNAAWRARIGFIPGSGLKTGGRQVTLEDVVIKARGQAQNLSTDFGKLQTLLESLPVFTGKADQLPPPSAVGGIDQPIHGELYFRCKERFPVQPGGGGSRAPSRQSQPFDAMSVGSGTGSSHVTDEHQARRRKNYDDAVLADVARAAVESFPLMPAPRQSQPSSRGSMTPVPPDSGTESIDQRRARRRDVNATGGSSLVGMSPSPVPTGSGVKSWQLSHVRAYEDGVY